MAARPTALATVACAVAVLAALVGLGTQMARDAINYLPSLNLDTPLVPHGVPPPAGPPLRRLSHRVILVMVDGLRLDTSLGLTFLDRLRGAGASGEAASHYPTLSHPNYVSIATGVAPRESGVRNNRFLKPVALDSLLARAYDAGLGTAYVSDFVGGLGQLFPAVLDEGAVAPWPGGLERLIRRTVAGDAALVWIHPGAADDAGHAFGGLSPEYAAAAAEIDAMLARTLAGVDLTRDTIIVTADHGHVDRGGHGGLEDEVTRVPLILAGAGIRPGTVPEHAGLVDLAPTICRLLGLPAPAYAFGRALTEVLTLTPDEMVRTSTTDTTRGVLLRFLVGANLTRQEAAAVVTRALRITLAVAAIVLCVVALVWLGRRGVLRVDRRVVAGALLPFPIFFYGAFGALGGFLSPSTLPETNEIEATLFTYGGAAALLSLAFTWLAVAFRQPPRERLAAAVAVVLLGLAVVLGPAAFAWIAAGPPFRTALPGPSLLLVPAVTFAGVACYAFAATIVLTVELFVYVSRTTAALPPRTA